jgi:hypothetical protein
MPRGYRNDGQPRQRRDGSGPVSVKVTAPANVVVPSRFSINQRFGFVTDMVNMVAGGDQASVIICGPGGLGKSHTVMQALRDRGFSDITLAEDFEVGTRINSRRSYTVVKGYSTAKGLFRTLYENQEGVIVFDDCDSVLKDPVCLSLLKTALDSYSRRVITWRADFKDEDLPNSFLFKGRVVFISNMSSAQLDQAIITRSLCVDLSMTTEQKVERMRHLLTSQEFMPEYDQAHKREAMDLIARVQDQVKELSLRTLIQCVKIRRANSPNWAELAEYAICG